jgi:flagella basal body P-ring formation protein FlgA
VAVLLCLLAWLTLEGRSAHAQSAEPDYPAMALNWARSAAQQAADPSLSLRLEVSVGALDSRLKLAACGNVEAYLPPGARLWGRSRVGLRCIDGMSRWNVTVPVQVKALGRAWVVRSQVQAGAALAQNDVVSVEVDWAEDTSPVLLEPALWLGQTATRSLSTGQVLRQGLVRPTQVFQAGTQVRVLAEGPGFAVSSDAQALAPGVVGQMTRVRMENGRVTSGTVLDAHTVKIDI